MANRIELQPSGHQFESKAGENILESALEHGVAFPYGCKNGFCGACKAKVSGDYEYQDEYKPQPLTEEELDEGVVICCKAEAKSDLTIEVEVVKGADEIKVPTMPTKVVKMEKLADDVVRLYLKTPDNESMQFLAGQYIEVLMEDGKRRAFSIANAPHNNDAIELHIRLVEGGYFTPHVFNEMTEKEILRIEGPLGGFYLREDSRNDIVMVAGGTGFAPIKGIIEHAIELGMKQTIHLYWGVRGEKDIYLKELAEQWAAEHENINFVPVLSDAAEGWEGRTGYVHEAVFEDFYDLSGRDLYVAGPPVMVNACKEACTQRKLPEKRFYSDSFEIAGKSEGKK